ncbi:MAG: bifunctional enoyl-CoA hydratase/phosphate acetyltransferase [Pseudomonadota bacterium]
MTILTNVTWAELEIDASASLDRLCRADDLVVFAHASGNRNPLHEADADGDGDGEPEAIAPAMWVASLVSAVLGNVLPGPGTRYHSQDLTFLAPVHPGQTVRTTVTLREKGDGRRAVFAVELERDDETPVARGTATVIAPEHKLSFDAADMPGLLVQDHHHFDRLLAMAQPLPPIPTAVVAPEEPAALGGALLAAEHTLITPVLIGCETKIRAAAQEIEAQLDTLQVINEADHSAAAARAVQLFHDGNVRALMKGHLHTDVLLRHVVKREGGLRTSRRLSHVFVMDVPGLDHLLFVSDAAINISPDLATKADITQNAIDVALALGVDEPKVGVLCAVETVNPAMPSTLDAAALAKMSERGQIKGGIVDGPLAMDNAIDLAAAQTKGIRSLVAGRADILIVPNLEAGNMLAKELTFVAHAQAGGLVMGAQCPVILTSRSDDERARLASCAVAALYDAHHRVAD